jgi:hypothetical protein
MGGRMEKPNGCEGIREPSNWPVRPANRHRYRSPLPRQRLSSTSNTWDECELSDGSKRSQTLFLRYQI